MTNNDRLAAVLPELEGITAREAGRRAGMDPEAAQKAMHRLVVAGRARRMRETYPTLYTRIDVAPAAPPVTSVEHAIKHAPNSVWALGGRQ